MCPAPLDGNTCHQDLAGTPIRIYFCRSAPISAGVWHRLRSEFEIRVAPTSAASILENMMYNSHRSLWQQVGDTKP